MASKLKIKVNGLVHSVTASLDTPLLYVLHNELHLHGPRFGCGLAQCGACSVLLDVQERCIEACGHRMNETVHLDLQLARQVTPPFREACIYQVVVAAVGLLKTSVAAVLVNEGSAARNGAAMVYCELQENVKRQCYLFLT